MKILIMKRLVVIAFWVLWTSCYASIARPMEREVETVICE